MTAKALLARSACFTILAWRVADSGSGSVYSCPVQRRALHVFLARATNVAAVNVRSALWYAKCQSSTERRRRLLVVVRSCVKMGSIRSALVPSAVGRLVVSTSS
jgi:hypothetical protein